MRRVYIAGPMRGRAGFNFLAFDHARDKLVEEGWGVHSPADMDREHEGWGLLPPVDLELTHDLKVRAMRRDLDVLLSFAPPNDAIYMLRGWRDSLGATTEHCLARFLGLQVLFEEGAR